MLAVAPFMWRRTATAWALLMLASMASWVAPATLIDAAGLIVFASWQQWQSRAIATLFAAMLWADLFNPAAHAIGEALGWGQMLCLILWASSGPQQNPMRRALQ